MDAMDGKERATILFERIEGKGILRSVFDEDGSPTSQTLIDPGSHTINDIALDGAAGFERVVEREYEEVVLRKACPKCGKAGMRRFREGKDVPVMPIFLCNSCGERGYRLSDRYLDEIIREKRELFSKEEQNELDADPDSFKKELKEYIIRIFASKRVSCIR